MILDLSLLGQLSAGELAMLAMAAALAGLVRGFSGFGAALIFLPVGSAILSPAIAAPVMLFVDNIAAAPLLVRSVRTTDWRTVFTMALGAAPMVPLGAALLAVGDAGTIRWAISAIVVALMVLIGSGWRYTGPRPASLSVLVGAVSGLFGGLSQISGPPVIAYWLSSPAPARVIRANIICYFAVASVISGLAYWLNGLLLLSMFAVVLTGAPIFAAALLLGSHLFGFASERLFRRIALLIILAAALIGLPALDGVRTTLLE